MASPVTDDSGRDDNDDTTSKPPTLLTIPPELVILIYEALAQTCVLAGPLNNHIIPDATSTALLQTCKQIRREAPSAFLRASQIFLIVNDWEFSPVRTYLATLNRQSRKCLQTNDRVSISLAAKAWDEDEYLPKLKAWWEFRERNAEIDFKYEVSRSSQGRKWKSKAQFLWLAGVEDFRQMRAKEGSVTKWWEMGRIISAFEAEAEGIVKELEAAEEKWLADFEGVIVRSQAYMAGAKTTAKAILRREKAAKRNARRRGRGKKKGDSTACT